MELPDFLTTEVLEHIQKHNWEPALTTEWECNFKQPSFDNERYEQLKKCFDSFMDKNEENKEDNSKCIFPILKRITINYNVDLKPLKPIY